MSRWAELIVRRVTIFSQTSLCRKVFLWVSGVSGENDICGSIEGRSILPCYLAGLNAHIVEVDQQAQDMLSRLIEQVAEQEGITELLKEENQM